MVLRQQLFCLYSTFIFAALSVTSISLAQQSAPNRGRLSLPDKNWGVALELSGFTVRTVETKPDGRRYMFAQNEAAGMTVSLTLEQIKPGTHAAACRESLQQRTKNQAVKVADVSFSRSGEFDVMQYTVPESLVRKSTRRMSS